MPIIDQRAADIARDVIDQRPVNVDAAASSAFAQVDTDRPAPAIDVDKLRFDVIEAGMQTVADYLPVLIAAAQAYIVHEVVRDRDGRIKKIKTTPAA